MAWFGLSPSKAYEITEIPRERWTMWHSIRRKWATERKGCPVRDLMEAGGWKNVVPRSWPRHLASLGRL